MSYLAKYIESKGRPVYMPYLTLGDPDFKQSVNYAISMIDAGADLLELGIPFSDPTADGPIIQAAMVRALANPDFSIEQVFTTAREIHSQRPEVPLVFLTYLNPVLTAFLKKSEKAGGIKPEKLSRIGIERFQQECKRSGIKGVVLPDLPFEEPETQLFQDLAHENGLEQIMMIAPNTSNERIKAICKRATGFIYYVTSMGVTGERKKLPPEISHRLELIRKESGVPVLAGFGINTPEQVRELKKRVDGIIVGSLNHRLIEEFGATAGTELARHTRNFVKELA